MFTKICDFLLPILIAMFFIVFVQMMTEVEMVSNQQAANYPSAEQSIHPQ